MVLICRNVTIMSLAGYIYLSQDKYEDRKSHYALLINKNVISRGNIAQRKIMVDMLPIQCCRILK